jgi:hypothetical protein
MVLSIKNLLYGVRQRNMGRGNVATANAGKKRKFAKKSEAECKPLLLPASGSPVPFRETKNRRPLGLRTPVDLQGRGEEKSAGLEGF